MTMTFASKAPVMLVSAVMSKKGNVQVRPLTGRRLMVPIWLWAIFQGDCNGMLHHVLWLLCLLIVEVRYCDPACLLEEEMEMELAEGLIGSTG
jgi:hypothetical protein